MKNSQTPDYYPTRCVEQCISTHLFEDLSNTASSHDRLSFGKSSLRDPLDNLISKIVYLSTTVRTNQKSLRVIDSILHGKQGANICVDLMETVGIDIENIKLDTGVNKYNTSN